MLSVDEALEHVRLAAGAPRLRVERVALDFALGRVLAADVHMDHAVPPFRRAAMDGHAIADLGSVGARYREVGRVAAGEVAPRPVVEGEAWRVMTGAPVPEGTQCVLPFEWTDVQGGVVHVRRRPGQDAHVVEAGAHVAAGALVLAAGQRLGPAALGVLATAGAAEVVVATRPRVAVLATGDELVGVDARPGPAQIRNSNNPTLRAQVRAHGGEAFDLGVARDEGPGLAAALERGLGADMLLISGGVSRGDLDLVPRTLLDLGVVQVFHGWAVQPGGPLWFGVRSDTLVVALPGNPAASFVGFEVLAAPALATRLGQVFRPRRVVRLPWQGPDVGPHARRRFRPVRIESSPEGGLRALPVGWKGSGDPFALAAAEGLAQLPEQGLAAGALVDVVLLEPGR